jgi:hypothetical protein
LWVGGTPVRKAEVPIGDIIEVPKNEDRGVVSARVGKLIKQMLV